MQEGRLSEPFTNAPHTVDIANALNVFGEPQPEAVNIILNFIALLHFVYEVC